MQADLVTTRVFALTQNTITSWIRLRSSLIEAFQETLGSSFSATLKDMLGTGVCESVFGLLEKNGIPRAEISNRFDDTVTVLTKILGASSRVLVHRTVLEMYRQYSMRADFSYQDSLRERLVVLREAVTANHLTPRNQRDAVDFDSVAMLPKVRSSA